MNYQGDPLVLKKPYTRFELHQFDMHRLVEVLEGEKVPFFAFEDNVEYSTWVIHIPDVFRPRFDEISRALKLDISSLHQELWYPERAHEAAVYGMRSKQAKVALIVVAIVLGVLLIVAMILTFFSL
ncbi:MAG: hypothetical protein WBG42_15595 [Cryomorphaceae bacterium]